jgi:ABC-2 type transport system permease protein
MLRNMLSIARLSLRLAFNRRSSYITFLVMPLLFTFLIGQASGSQNTSGSTAWPLWVLNEDSGQLGDILITQLQNQSELTVVASALEEGKIAVQEEEAIAFLVIPSDFSERVADGVVLDFYIDPANTRRIQPVEQIVLTTVGELGGAVSVATFSTGLAERLGLFTNTEQDPDVYFEQGMVEALAAWESPPITVIAEVETAFESVAIPEGTNQSSPGMMVMFAMFLMLSGAATLVVEREMGTLRRLMVMPVNKLSLILGKMLGIYASGLVQITILIVIGTLAFGVQWGRSPAALIIVVLGFAFAITGMSMMIAAIAKTPAQVNSISTLLVLSMASLGGAWWPLEVVPSWMKTLAYATPVAWAMDGFHDIITRGLGVAAVLPEFGVLVAFGTLFLVVGVTRFKYE